MKKLISILLIFALALSISACAAAPAPAETAAPETTQAATEAPAEAASPFPVTLTDQAGRTVTIDESPARIVSGYYISTSALIALHVQDRLVGIEAKADKRPIYRLSAPELIDLPSVGTAKEFDLEGCIALEPDLVILPLKLKDVAETLESFNIPVLLVNPESQELLRTTMELLAQATGTTENAEAIFSFLKEQEELLAGITGERPTVYLGGNSSFLSTAGGSMYQSGMITLAGGTNVAAELTDTYWTEISYEQLLAWNPEYIILASDAAYSVEDVLNDTNLSGCRAVANGNVFQIPGNAESWDSPIPSGILGSLWLASILHEDQITQDMAASAAASFYEQFYGFTYQLP